MPSRRRSFLAGAGVAGLWSALSPAQAAAGWLCGRKRHHAKAAYCQPCPCPCLVPIGTPDIPHAGKITFEPAKHWITLQGRGLYDIIASGGRLDIAIVDKLMYPYVQWWPRTMIDINAVGQGSQTEPDMVTFQASARPCWRRCYGAGEVTITLIPNGRTACARSWPPIRVVYTQI